MDFNELSNIWNETNPKEANFAINEKLLMKASSNTIMDRLKGFKWYSFFELVVNYYWTVFLIGFIVDVHDENRFLLPALLLLFIAIYTILFETYKLTLYYSIDNQLSILKTQKKLERLRFLELFDNNSLYFFIPLFFIPFIVVFAKGFLGVDLYSLGFSGREILFGTAGSFIVAVIIIFFLNRFPNKELKESIDFMKELSAVQKGNDF